MGKGLTIHPDCSQYGKEEETGRLEEWNVGTREMRPEDWNSGMLEHWVKQRTRNIGTMECWNDG